MSGFSAKWLSQREPADHRARDAGLLRRLAAWSAGRDSLAVVDLGCGAGSNARAMMPHLPARQHWRMVDYDRALLAVAAATTPASPERRVETVQADLSQGVEPLLAPPCELVTAAALFDLVSRPWLDGLVAALAARALPLYTALTYDGAMTWDPAHPLDEPLRASFNAHQGRDKGFGPAAGPEAGAHLAGRLSEAGYQVLTAPSPWRLGPEDHALLVTNAVGVANAAREMGDLSEAAIEDWLALRRQQGGRCVIGHLDLLACPPGAAPDPRQAATRAWAAAAMGQTETGAAGSGEPSAASPIGRGGMANASSPASSPRMLSRFSQKWPPVLGSKNLLAKGS